jgi:hypothetical protein
MASSIGAAGRASKADLVEELSAEISCASTSEEPSRSGMRRAATIICNKA